MKATGGIGLAWFVATVFAVAIAAVAVGGVRSEVTDTPTALGVSASPAITVLTPSVPGEAPDGSSDLPGTPPPTLAPVVGTASPDDPIVETTTTTTTISVTTTTRPPDAIQTGGNPRETEEPEPTKSRPQSGSPSTTPTTQPSTTTTTLATVTPDIVTETETETTEPSATSTTTKAQTAYTRLVDTEGGSVAIRVEGDEVLFRRAFPSPGWKFDLLDGGPETVEARFSKTDDRSTKLLVSITVADGTLEISITSPN